MSVPISQYGRAGQTPNYMNSGGASDMNATQNTLYSVLGVIDAFDHGQTQFKSAAELNSFVATQIQTLDPVQLGQVVSTMDANVWQRVSGILSTTNPGYLSQVSPYVAATTQCGSNIFSTPSSIPFGGMPSGQIMDPFAGFAQYPSYPQQQYPSYPQQQYPSYPPQAMPQNDGKASAPQIAKNIVSFLGNLTADAFKASEEEKTDKKDDETKTYKSDGAKALAGAYDELKGLSTKERKEIMEVIAEAIRDYARENDGDDAKLPAEIAKTIDFFKAAFPSEWKSVAEDVLVDDKKVKKMLGDDAKDILTGQTRAHTGSGSTEFKNALNELDTKSTTSGDSDVEWDSIKDKDGGGEIRKYTKENDDGSTEVRTQETDKDGKVTKDETITKKDDKEISKRVGTDTNNNGILDLYTTTNDKGVPVKKEQYTSGKLDSISTFDGDKTWTTKNPDGAVISKEVKVDDKKSTREDFDAGKDKPRSTWDITKNNDGSRTEVGKEMKDGNATGKEITRTYDKDGKLTSEKVKEANGTITEKMGDKDLTLKNGQSMDDLKKTMDNYSEVYKNATPEQKSKMQNDLADYIMQMLAEDRVDDAYTALKHLQSKNINSDEQNLFKNTLKLVEGHRAHASVSQKSKDNVIKLFDKKAKDDKWSDISGTNNLLSDSTGQKDRASAGIDANVAILTDGNKSQEEEEKDKAIEAIANTLAGLWNRYSVDDNFNQEAKDLKKALEIAPDLLEKVKKKLKDKNKDMEAKFKAA